MVLAVQAAAQAERHTVLGLTFDGHSPHLCSHGLGILLHCSSLITIRLGQIAVTEVHSVTKSL